MLTKETIRLQIGLDVQSGEWRMTLIGNNYTRVLVAATSEADLVSKIVAKFETETSQ
jgi:hypothetical protein